MDYLLLVHTMFYRVTIPKGHYSTRNIKELFRKLLLPKNEGSGVRGIFSRGGKVTFPDFFPV